MSSKHALTRRSALKLTGGSLAAVTASGLGTAENGDVIRINVGYDAADGRKAALDAASEVVREFTFDALTVDVPQQAVSALETAPNVRYVERDGTWNALVCGCLGCGIDTTMADFSCGEGAGADLAIVDTGIQSGHSCLEEQLGDGVACTSCQGSQCGCYYDWDDDNGHGTYVAAIAGGENGVAREATLRAVKVLDGAGSGSWSDIACGIENVADRGWHVANMSLGGSSGSSVVEDACEYAYDSGVLLVGAAGNDYGGPVVYPAAYETVMAVSAVDCTDDWADFSNEGSEVEICAPGAGVMSATLCDLCDTGSGTSAAAPHVAGAGAILMSQGYTNEEARRRLCETADDVGLPPERQGCGRVNVERATC